MEIKMGVPCSKCGEDALYSAPGELIFNNHIKKKCTAVFCNRCKNWESVTKLDNKTQEIISNPYEEIKKYQEIIAKNESDIDGMQGIADHHNAELIKTKQALAQCQNELRQLKQSREKR